MAYYFRDMRFDTHPQVYEPAEDSTLLAENLAVNAGDTVLDVGTGSGIQAIAASKTAWKVLAVDINPEALKLAKDNAKENNAINIEFRSSDLFAGIKGDEKFDLIIFNPPYVPSEEKDILGRAWAGGRNGGEVIERFIHEAPGHLKEGGRTQLLVSSLNDLEYVKKLFEKRGFAAKVVASEKLWFEELYVLVAAKE